MSFLEYVGVKIFIGRGITNERAFITMACILYHVCVCVWVGGWVWVVHFIHDLSPRFHNNSDLETVMYRCNP